MVRTYHDPVKQLAREKLREFIKKRLLSSKNPEDLRVVCFPGAEVKGEEALEVKEVYDPLGIPRQNITGLEVDAEKTERLRRANLGIHVINARDADFFKKTDGRYDVISLDYTGQQTDAVVEALKQISGRHLLGLEGVLMTNFLGQRESEHMKKILSLKLLGSLKEDYDEFRKDIKGMLAIAEGTSEQDLDEIRNAVTMHTRRLLAGGTANLHQLGALAAHPYSEFVNRHITTLFRKVYTHLDSDPTLQKLLSLGTMKRDDLEAMQHDATAAKTEWPHFQRKYLAIHLSQKYHIPIDIANNFVILLEWSEADGYHVSEIERYRYISNKNSSMMTDVFYTKRLSGVIPGLDDMIGVVNGKVTINPKKLSRNEFYRRSVKITRAQVAIQGGIEKLPEQVFLGSSYRRPTRISRKDAIDLLKSGCTPVEIADCYGGFTKMQLAAFKAHYITMGKPLH